jgi:hypothetical protein
MQSGERHQVMIGHVVGSDHQIGSETPILGAHVVWNDVWEERQQV